MAAAGLLWDEWCGRSDDRKLVDCERCTWGCSVRLLDESPHSQSPAEARLEPVLRTLMSQHFRPLLTSSDDSKQYYECIVRIAPSISVQAILPTVAVVPDRCTICAPSDTLRAAMPKRVAMKGEDPLTAG